jgi:hypothetical protein
VRTFSIPKQAFERRHRAWPWARPDLAASFLPWCRTRERGDDGRNGASPERRERFDDRIAKPDVVARKKRPHQMLEQRRVRAEQKGDLTGFLADAPVPVAEGPQNELGRVRRCKIRNHGHRTPSHLGIG